MVVRREVEHRCDDPFAIERAATEVAVHLTPYPRQRPCERRKAVVLGLVAYLSPFRVVAVLLSRRASLPVAWIWPVGERQIQTSVHAGGIASDSIRDRSLRLEIVAPEVQVLEAAAPPTPGDPRLAIAHIAKAGGARRPLGLNFGVAAVRSCHVGSDTRGRGRPTAFHAMPAPGTHKPSCSQAPTTTLEVDPGPPPSTPQPPAPPEPPAMPPATPHRSDRLIPTVPPIRTNPA